MEMVSSLPALKENQAVISFFKKQTHRTQKLYKEAIEEFFGEPIKNLTLEEIRKINFVDVINYKRGLIDRGLKSSTINIKLSGLRSFFRFLKTVGLISFNPADPEIVPSPKQEKYSNTPVLNEDEVAKLFKAVESETNKLIRTRDIALIRLLFNGALRRSEVLKIRPKDIIFEQDCAILILQQTKSQKRQVVKIDQKTKEAIKEYIHLARIQPDEYLFKSLSNNNKNKPLSYESIRFLVKKYAKKAKIDKKVSPHTLRHSFATISRQKGAPLEKIQLHLRHASITTTMRYLHHLNVLENSAVDYVNI